MYYTKCPYCGANLDPGERCDCQNANEGIVMVRLTPDEKIFIEALRGAPSLADTMAGTLSPKEERRPPAGTSEASAINEANGPDHTFMIT